MTAFWVTFWDTKLWNNSFLLDIHIFTNNSTLMPTESCRYMQLLHIAL